MLGQRRRRWPNIETALDERFMFAGFTVHIIMHCSLVYVYRHLFSIINIHATSPFPLEGSRDLQYAARIPNCIEPFHEKCAMFNKPQ